MDSFICQECKHKKLAQIGIKMSVGSIPCKYGECDCCGLWFDELYSYKEEKVKDGKE